MVLVRIMALLLAIPVLASCSRTPPDKAPVRVTTPIEIEAAPSIIAIPVTARLGTLAAALDRSIPKQLWSIDRPGQTCVAPKGVDLGIATIKTPRIKCRIVGTVTRGDLRLSGSGRTIEVAIPLNAVVRAEDIGGVISRETATARAMARAEIRLDLAEDWTPRGSADLHYDWTDEPHVEFLGQRIDFADKADAKLKPVIARLERDLPAELKKLGIREEVEKAWQSAFTILSLNDQNPPVWMRVTPQTLDYGGYRIDGQTIRLNLGMKALTEAFVGNKPAPPSPAPLPNMTRMDRKPGKVSFVVPVVADYRQLEPVLLRALVKRSARPFSLPGVGDVRAEFRKVTIYATKDDRIAVGIVFAAREIGSRDAATTGTVWLTGEPTNAKNSRAVQIEDLKVSGTTDMTGGDLILQLVNAPGIKSFVAASLAQNFEKDFDDLLRKVKAAVSSTQEGDFAISADITRVTTGKISVTGAGLFLPARIEGTARVALQ